MVTNHLCLTPQEAITPLMAMNHFSTTLLQTIIQQMATNHFSLTLQEAVILQMVIKHFTVTIQVIIILQMEILRFTAIPLVTKNTANGFQALYNNTSGQRNVANGAESLLDNTTGFHNTANGYAALQNNIDGSENTANGLQALNSNTSGSRNTANGKLALSDNTTGSNNIAVGYNAQVGAGLSNQVRIGDQNIIHASIKVAWTTSSDKRWKENIRELPYGLNLVKQLKPVDYVRKNNDAKTREMGFIAQDVEVLLDKIGYKDQGFLSKDDKGFMSLRYNDFIGILTKAIQEQQDIIKVLQSTVGSQKSEIQSLTGDLVESKKEQSDNYKILLKRIEQLEKTNNQ